MFLSRPRLAGVLLAALALGLTAGPARADVVSPDSIVRPPPGTLGSANLTPITSAADLVTTQYAGLGLTFPAPPGPPAGMGSTTAISRLRVADVWVPATRTEAVASSVGFINYASTLTGALGLTPASALTVEYIGPGVGVLSVFDKGGHLLGTTFAGGVVGPHGGVLLTLTDPGITSFTVGPPLLPLAGAFPPVGLPWGVAQVSFTPASAPEPGALTLCAVGALGLAGCARRRRRAAR
jgi:hypothetical protein